MSRHVRARAGIIFVGLCLLASLAPAGPSALVARGATNQNGPRNYAGPTCPGDDWTCTKKTNGVVQSGDENVFECTKANCSVVQQTDGGSNLARCTQATDGSGDQRCAVDQTSEGGSNAITIDQTAELRAAARRVVQRSQQTSETAQHSVGGRNSLTITQHIGHDAASLQGKKSKRQIQDAAQRAQIVQFSTSGDQNIEVDQDQDLVQNATSSKRVTQNQNVLDDGADISVDVDQITTSGANSFDADQDLTFTQTATAPAAEQLQGSEEGGAEVGSTDKAPEPWGIESDAAAGGTSGAVIDQSKTWTQNATAPSEARSQRQIDKLRVASLGLSPDSTTVTQDSDLVADAGAQQRCLQQVDTHAEVSGHATGSCTVDDHDGPPITSTKTSNDPNLRYENSVDSTAETGSLSGFVKDATDESPVAGALVEIEDLSLSTVTQTNGSYQFADVPVGTHSVRVTASGFAEAVRDADISSGEMTRLDVHLSPRLASGELRIVLSWAAAPSDLDAHLWLPASKPYHVYYGRRGSLTACPHAALDNDTRSGFGPETVTIAGLVDGTYRYAVHNWSAETPIHDSDAVVQLFDESGQIASYEIPTTGSASDHWWKVLEFSVAGGEVTSLNPINTIVFSSPEPYADTAAGCAA